MEVFATILFAALMLIATVGVDVAARHLAIPHTVLLAALGLAVGLVFEADGTPIVSAFDLTSEGMLYVFLPVLLFQAGLATDVRGLRGDMAAVLLLAVVAVVVCTVVVGFVLAAVSPFPLLLCLLLGAIVATTDPVAVLAIFKDVGAPRRLTNLIEGESLLNDAAALVIFGILTSAMIGGSVPTASNAVFAFLVSFVGGALFGAFAGRLLLVALRFLRQLAVAATTLTVAVAYLTFVVAQEGMAISGVVAVVVCAMTVSRQLKLTVNAATGRWLDTVWQQLSYFSAALIFLLGATVVPRFAEGFSLALPFWVIAVVLATLVARALVIFGVFPILSALRLTEDMGPQLKTVVVWGGLRGALTLLLALSVFEADAIPEQEEQRASIALLASVYVFFTLAVQGTTLRPIMRMLGLQRLGPVDRSWRQRAATAAQRLAFARLPAIARSHGLSSDLVSWVTAALGGGGENAPGFERDEQIRRGLAILAYREADLAAEHHSNGLVSRRAAERISERAMRMVDAASLNGAKGYVDAAQQRPLEARVLFGAALLLHRHFRWHRLLASILALRFEQAIVTRSILSELRLLVDHQLPDLLDRNVCRTLVGIISSRQDKTAGDIEALRTEYAEFARRLELRFLQQVFVRLQMSAISAFAREAVVRGDVLDEISRELESAQFGEGDLPELDLGLETRRLLARSPLFAQLDPEALEDLAATLTPVLAVPGERVVRRGQRGDSMFFIASGTLEVRSDTEVVRLESGDFFGELALVTLRPRSADVVSLGFSRLLVLRRRAYYHFLKRHAELHEHIRRVAEQRLDQERRREPSDLPPVS